MPEVGRWLLRAIGVGVLYVLAFPFLIPAALRWLRSRGALQRAMRDGGTRCPHCGFWVNLLGQGTCRRCGWTEWGFTIACSSCKEIVHWTSCPRCFNSVKVW